MRAHSHLAVIAVTFCVCVFHHPAYLPQHSQSRQRRPSVLHAPNAALSRNLENVAVAVSVVRGSETVEVQVTQRLATRGTRVYGPARTTSYRIWWFYNFRLLNQKPISPLVIPAQV